MSPLARRSLHARLAERVPTTRTCAHGISRSRTDEPDAEVAALLEDAAAARAARAARSTLAAEFAEHSLRLTPRGGRRDAGAGGPWREIEPSRRGRRDEPRARARRPARRRRCPPGPGARRGTRASARSSRTTTSSAGEAFLLGERSRTRATDEPLRGRVLDQLGWLRGVFRGDLRAGIECAREALAIAERRRRPRVPDVGRGRAVEHGGPRRQPRPDLMARAVALEQELGRPALWAGPRVLLAEQLLWAGDLAAARTLLEAALGDAARSGNERWRPYRLYDLALGGVRSRRPRACGRARAPGASRRRATARTPHVASWIFYRLALVAAWLGRAERGAGGRRGTAPRGGRARGERPGIARARSVLGLLALSEGDAAAAAAELPRRARLLDEMGFAHPGAIPVLPGRDRGARGLAGDVAAAAALLDGSTARPTGARQRLASAALAERCGAVAARRGRRREPRRRSRPPAASLRPARLPARRRARRARSQGRRCCAPAAGPQPPTRSRTRATRFAAMGASLWEARAAEELERAAPGRAAGELTPAERRVAALVAAGHEATARSARRCT